MIVQSNNCIAYVQSPLFKCCEHVIPYLPFIFKNKRERVKCRWFFRYYHMQQAQEAIVEMLMTYTAEPYKPPKLDFEDMEWDLTTDRSVL